MNLNQLKAELTEKENELKSHLKQGVVNFTCQAEISALKKGIECCEQREKGILEMIDKKREDYFERDDLDSDEIDTTILNELKQQLKEGVK